jgi:hypothetical protein
MHKKRKWGKQESKTWLMVPLYVHSSSTGKYCEFHQLYRAGEFRDAAALLVSLLASRLAPKRLVKV